MAPTPRRVPAASRTGRARPETGPRVVIGTANGFIVQIDAKTGQLVPGPAGVMNMATGVTEKFVTQPGAEPSYSMNTPPAIYKNLAIIAGRTGEGGRYGIPGDPRALRPDDRQGSLALPHRPLRG